MTELLLHPKTEAQLAALITNQPNAVLVAGVEGSGKGTLSAFLAGRLLGVDDPEGQAYFLRINPAGESISIDEIRELQQFLKLKVPRTGQGIRRIVLIDRTERMRTEAQNALLKTLEEPPADTCIILTTGGSELLLPTITSRTQELVILPVTEAQATEYFKNLGKKASDIAKYYALSQGQAGLLHALLHDESHPLSQQVELAKQILAEPVSERLLRTDELAKDKQSVKLLLNAFGRIAHAALSASAKQQKDNVVQQWHRRQAAIVEASTIFVYNPNMKLLLDDLFLSI